MRGDDVHLGREQLPHPAHLTYSAATRVLPPSEKSEIRDFYGDWLSVLDLKREKNEHLI